MSDDGFNLYEIEKGLRELESSGGRAALELKNQRLALVEARRVLRQAKAKATFEASGTVQMKAAYVDQQTDEQQYQFELAEVEVKYAADIVDERSSTRSSLQTRAKLAMESMKLAGHGGGV
ncbi:hypothetical protein [Rhodococcus jostii]|uniref:hypothetical protein n=1 Tax=Rhodococcus jostii TaxID=132919 RepID=UPI003638F24D